ncbi:hypothetical protein [Halorhabdus salina]|uniref:hypothetical protein n=1 Tax=Halorhabdus salina TaxID=2750670 RepID=UPI0015EF1737|nr:hypothetical protein [Halorhabdus salina]
MTDPTLGGTLPLALDITAGALGLAVGYVAYHGYRRNESLPMLCIAAGFLLTFWAPVALDGGLVVLEASLTFGTTVRAALPAGVELAARTVEVVGLLVILYGLAMPIRR